MWEKKNASLKCKTFHYFTFFFLLCNIQPEIFQLNFSLSENKEEIVIQFPSREGRRKKKKERIDNAMRDTENALEKNINSICSVNENAPILPLEVRKNYFSHFLRFFSKK